MILTPKIRESLRLAAKQHEGQKRKDNVTPFIIHPFEVAWLVSQHTDDENIISAALLHDVVEDTNGCSLDDIGKSFGDKVKEIVSTVTDPESEGLTWNELHQKCLEKIKNGCDGAVLIFLADKYTTISSGPIVKERLWYYTEIINIARNRGLTKNSELLKEFERLLGV